MSNHRAILLLLLASAFVRAQEIKYVDLSLVSQRTNLRYPPAPPPDCKDGVCTGGGFGGGSVACGAADQRDPHALGVFLLRVTPNDIDPAVPFEAEFRVLNTGLASIPLPVSPHLSDLQPNDEAVAFSYLSLALVIQARSDQPATDGFSVGSVDLYGSPDHEGTLLVLRPGEWIRVKANVKLCPGERRPAEGGLARLLGSFSLQRITFRPHPGGSVTETVNLYPNVTATPPVAVHLLPSAASDQAKQ